MSSFDLRDLKHFLGAGTLYYQPSMTSTSDVARALLEQNPDATLPLLVLCDQQTAGRGQPGKSWHSNKDSLTLTWCISEDSVPKSNRPLLSLIAGVSVCEAIESPGLSSVKLKWPNDILINQKKACGILVEKTRSPSGSQFMLGIGVNVNQQNMVTLPAEKDAAFPATSLRESFGQPTDLHRLLVKIIQRLNVNIQLQVDWQQACNLRLEFLNQPVRFRQADGKVIDGIIVGVDAAGRLNLDCDGKLESFISGSILF